MKAARKRQRRNKRKARHFDRRRNRRRQRTLRQAIRAFLPQCIFANLPLHGNGQWSMFALTLVALFWAWSSESTLGDRLDVARMTAERWLPGAYLATSYLGFIKALARHNADLVKLVTKQLQLAMQRLAADHWKVAGYAAFAVDGSKVEACWTQANEAKLGKKGRKPKGKCRRRETDLRPQLTLTLLWHLGMQLPWTWRHGGLEEGERTQFLGLLDTLPKGALIIADAGFVGYLLWRVILESDRHFLIRVGANVELLTELCPGATIERQGNIVYLWPKDKREKREPPLQLRLILLRQRGQTIHLVTSILDPAKLTDEQAALLYAKRWSVECAFRGLKQTFERRKMRSHRPEHAACELDWSLIGLWLVGLLAKQELIAVGESPTRMSLAGAVRRLRRGLRGPLFGCDFEVAELRFAVTDQYQRNSKKNARHDPRQKRTKPPGAPRIHRASAAQRRAAKEFAQPIHAAA